MNVKVENKRTTEIYQTSILQQSAFWSQVKRKLGIASKAFDIKVKASDLYVCARHQKYVVDDVLILFQDIGDGYSIGYLPYGPTLKPSEENQGPFLEELSESLRPHLPSNCVMLRYDLLWESLWAQDDSFYDEHGDWIGPPKKANQEIRLNFDTHKWNLKKANTNILPPDTVFLDLKKGSQHLLNEMKSKTRYNIRLSSRRGVRVRSADRHDLDIWYTLYMETCRRNNIHLDGIKYFQAVLGASNSRTQSPATVQMLIAEVDETPLAAMFLVFSGQRATYLYGASSSKSRHFMATYALQWEAIQRAQQNGCTEYDMFGVSPQPDASHPLYGLYRFKVGFGGSLFHRMGCWDYPFDSRTYDHIITAEMNSHGYHL